MRVVLFYLVFFLSFSSIYAQYGRCGVDQKLEAMPVYADQLLKDWQMGAPVSQSTTDSIIIPLHIIIVHPSGQAIGQGSNLSNERIVSQILATNKDFRRLNDNRNATPVEFPVGDSGISFQLASIDPDGQPTDGVTRYETDLDFDQEELSVKQATAWPRDTYLNVWVAPTLDDLGFAYIPSVQLLPNETLDGCAVLTQTFGGPGFATFVPYNLGRTLTHEIGHFLGLRHIWNTDGCGPDDGIADTPRQDTSHFGCPVHPLPSCNNTGDMFMNYMDYTDDACMSAFTVGQIDYMWQVLNGSRRSLLTAGDRAFEVVEPVVVTVVDQSSPTCYGGFDGSITVQGAGGVGNFRYRINGGSYQGSPLFRFLTAGRYVVEVVDNDGLSALSDTIVLSQPQEIAVLAADIDNPFCHGDRTGSIDLLIIGNQGPAMLNVDAGITDGLSIDSLEGGPVSVQIVDSLGCMVDTAFTVIEADPILPTANTNHISCYGAADGSVSFTASGGTPPYQYSFDGVRFNDKDTYDGYAADQYDVFIRDNFGCVVRDSFEILQPDSLMLDLQILTGGVAAIPQGGTAPYRYQLNGGPIVSDSIFDGLSAQTYQVTVIDANDCMTTTSAILTSNEEEAEVSSFLFWPQPAQQHLFVGAGVNTMTLYSISSSEAPQVLHFDGANPISISDIAAGMYVVVLDLKDGSRVVDRLVILR